MLSPCQYTFRITRQNLLSHMRPILYGDLPSTFQDSVAVVRALGIRYVRIDSLCIIQDIPQDWEEESVKMGARYQGAWITISTGTAEGCLVKSNVRDMLPCAQPFNFKKTFTYDCAPSEETILTMLLRPYKSPSAGAFNKYPKHGRGWVFPGEVASQTNLVFD